MYYPRFFVDLGDSKSPLLFVLVACIINIIGDLVLVAGLHMDAAGAAVGNRGWHRRAASSLQSVFW